MEPAQATQQPRVEHYTTLTDPTFLAGLESILQPFFDQRASEQEIRGIAERAEAFYLSTRAEPDLEQPQPLSALAPPHPSSAAPPSTYRQEPAASSASTSDAAAVNVEEGKGDQPPYPPTFAELAQLIATGAPVPGIKDIPDLLAADPPTESTAPPKRKPWEQQQQGDGSVASSEVARGAANDADEREQASRDVARVLGLDPAGTSPAQDEPMRDA
ncbi:hypothetical protein JCM3774_005726 [Rhodotorula dairenensis]